MEKYRYILIIPIFIFISSCVTQQVKRNELLDYPVQPGGTIKRPPSDKANVIFIRPNINLNLYSTAIYDNNEFVSLLTTFTHTQYLTKPGKRQFMVSIFSGYPDFLDAEIEAGKTYVVKIDWVQKGLVGIWPDSGIKLLPVKPDSDDWKQIKTWMNKSHEIITNDRSRKWAQEQYDSVMEKKKAALPKWQQWEGRTYLKPEYGVTGINQ